MDALLSPAIASVSSRFDKECGRTLARTEKAVYEFDPRQTEICPPCYPIESVTKFETKTCEAEGWQELTPIPGFLIRNACVISLTTPLSQFRTANSTRRITYTGGYVLPGALLADGQTPLPAELEHAAVEQVAYWFQNRDKLGAIRYWPKGAVYEQFADLDLLPSVRAVLAQYRRWQM